MRIACSVQTIDLDLDDGDTVEGIRTTCNRCDHRTESFGTSDRSVRRCFALMRQQCPRDGNNFYVAERHAEYAE